MGGTVKETALVLVASGAVILFCNVTLEKS
jgi:hypothetical protein